MELSQLRYFSAVAQLENMSKAAEIMFVSQPNLSTSISRLEEEVGVPLFERRRGKIILNQSGKCFCTMWNWLWPPLTAECGRFEA